MNNNDNQKTVNTKYTHTMTREAVRTTLYALRLTPSLYSLLHALGPLLSQSRRTRITSTKSDDRGFQD